ncbi:hypothetical protein ACN6K8_000937 [[Kitasatospora] papulosa]
MRAAVFALVCVLLAALGHVTMSGSPVPWWAMVSGVAGVGTAGWLLAGRERGRTMIVAVVTAAQTVLHEMFSLAQTVTPIPARGCSTKSCAQGPHDMQAHMHATGSMDMGAMHMGSASHAGHGMTGLPTQDIAGPAVHDMSTMSDAATVGMFAAHLLAAVLCGLWLAYGERAVFRVLRTAAGRLAVPFRLLWALPTPVFRPTVRRRRFAAPPVPVRLLLCCSLSFRGPPAGTAVI